MRVRVLSELYVGMSRESVRGSPPKNCKCGGVPWMGRYVVCNELSMRVIKCRRGMGSEQDQLT